MMPGAFNICRSRVVGRMCILPAAVPLEAGLVSGPAPGPRLTYHRTKHVDPKARPLTRLREKPSVPARMRRTLLVLVMVIAMVAVGRPVLGANVAVIMSSKVDDYREALRGFREVARHRIVAEYDMGGDPDKGPAIVAEIETKVKPDLIFAVGIWALQAVLAQPTDIPVVYAMVLNPPSVLGDVRNITGASMNVPVEESIRLLKQL